ncbi:hypothetical protein WG926_01815 [Tistrella sp. BH-R2-4]|uniref:Uncharacterized protein n=1 Tax=Tistrella arctica TaxID=3133430 RepID=A0ABU9YE11_9PROT
MSLAASISSKISRRLAHGLGREALALQLGQRADAGIAGDCHMRQHRGERRDATDIVDRFLEGRLAGLGDAGHDAHGQAQLAHATRHADDVRGAAAHLGIGAHTLVAQNGGDTGGGGEERAAGRTGQDGQRFGFGTLIGGTRRAGGQDRGRGQGQGRDGGGAKQVAIEGPGHEASHLFILMGCVLRGGRACGGVAPAGCAAMPAAMAADGWW